MDATEGKTREHAACPREPLHSVSYPGQATAKSPSAFIFNSNPASFRRNTCGESLYMRRSPTLWLWRSDPLIRPWHEFGARRVGGLIIALSQACSCCGDIRREVSRWRRVVGVSGNRVRKTDEFASSGSLNQFLRGYHMPAVRMG